VPRPIPRRTKPVHASIASLSTRPSPSQCRVGVRHSTFEACSGFTRVAARWIARPPKAAFVTRLQSVRLLVQTARQLPDQSTTLWGESSSTGHTRLRGAHRADRRRDPAPINRQRSTQASDYCEFRRKPAGDTDLKPATIPRCSRPPDPVNRFSSFAPRGSATAALPARR